MSVQQCTLLFLVKGPLILLAQKKRGFGKGLWNGAGGKVEPGEPVEQAMIRECQEEIGVTPTVYQKVALHEFLYAAGGQEVQVYTYLCSEWLGEPIETEEMMPKWFEQSRIPYDQMWPDDELWLPQVLAGKKLHTQFTFNNKEQLIGSKIHEAAGMELDG